MILSDSAILAAIETGQIVIKPFNRGQLGSNSYDVRLSENIAEYAHGVLDAAQDNPIAYYKIPPTGTILRPNRLYLCSTIEYTETHGFVPFLEGKSSAGRLGISIHETAGKGDAGFCGHWTLEVTVTLPVRVYAGMPIAQLIYHSIQGEILTPYNRKASAKYAGQGELPQPSQMFKNLW
jgi:dCTP deaminase